MSIKKYGQFIDHQSVRIQIGDHSFDLEICDDHAIGLSGRSSMGRYEGMLFKFNPGSPVQFHMKNCKFPIDVLFCKDNKIVKISPSCPPCGPEDCPKYKCDSVDYVVELPGNTCSHLNIKLGDSAELS